MEECLLKPEATLTPKELLLQRHPEAAHGLITALKSQ